MGIALLYLGIVVTVFAALFTLPAAWVNGDRVGNKERVWWRAAGFTLLTAGIICFAAYGLAGIAFLPGLSPGPVSAFEYLQFAAAGTAASCVVLVPISALVFGAAWFLGRRSFTRARVQEKA
ncbi:hypothetical protein J4729_16330 [Leisingera sp. HS039]|uniref:hypothetical protein n=1 Tax=unclassified Leisingera TaxID=2614906 RepID=UPI001070F521|nr:MULTISPECIES: hypothetical protein [unclassified Leisingera]MBQ4826109.1 hypothetical protein [Leisingera sp. HS039]MDC0658672.1 hypothetical protein [Leisingera sp. SS27]QBR35124.1 hypothetical protein ETW23_02040 [Leisingera sp. NJS201]